MSDALTLAVERLSRVPGVRGAVLVDPQAGVPVQGEVMAGTDPNAVAAFATTMYRQASAGAAPPRTLQLEAAEGALFVHAVREFLLVVLTSRDAQLGRVRVEVRRTAESLP